MTALWWALAIVNVNLALTAVCPISEGVMRRVIARRPHARSTLIAVTVTLGAGLVIYTWAVALVHRWR